LKSAFCGMASARSSAAGSGTAGAAGSRGVAVIGVVSGEAGAAGAGAAGCAGAPPIARRVTAPLRTSLMRAGERAPLGVSRGATDWGAVARWGAGPGAAASGATSATAAVSAISMGES
jgi:hypothetical protein